MRLAIALLVLLAAAPVDGQATDAREIEIRADVGLPGAGDRFVVVTVRGRTIVGCVTSASRRCTRTRAVILDAAARAELERLLAAVDAMPLCEPVGFAPGDPELTLTIGDREARGHLPRARSAVRARIDEPCEAEHALAWWIAQRFERR
ncbi:MAG: hypothetical protein M3Y87_32075 [Myxococcota bacterium]|nr:hypothetical protein [Myxococcota bacterium]